MQWASFHSRGIQIFWLLELCQRGEWGGGTGHHDVNVCKATQSDLQATLERDSSRPELAG